MVFPHFILLFTIEVFISFVSKHIQEKKKNIMRAQLERIDIGWNASNHAIFSFAHLIELVLAENRFLKPHKLFCWSSRGG